MAKKDEARRAEMRRLIAEQEASGMSVARFARERGIKPWSIYNWRRQLQAQAPSAFVEFQVKRSLTAPLAIELANGARVHVPRDFDGDHLRRVIAALSAC